MKRSATSMRGDKCTRGRRPEFQSPTTPCISAKPRVGGSLSRGFDPWQSEAGSGEGRGTRGPCKRSTRESDLGGAPCAASGPWANLALLGGEGSSCEKGMVSANQILEIVVTPKAAEKGKKVALAWDLHASEDVVQTERLLQTSQSGCCTPRLFPSTI